MRRDVFMKEKVKFLIILSFLLTFLSCTSKEIVVVRKSQNPPPAKNYGQKVASRNHLENGIKFFHKAKFGKALQEFKKAVDKDPRNWEAYYYLGFTYQKLGYYKRSISKFKIALELNKGDKVRVSEIRVCLGRSLEFLGNFEKAKAQYQLAMSLDPGNEEASSGYSRIKRKGKK